MEAQGISLQGRLLLARHEAKLREASTPSVAYPHLTTYPAIGAVRIEVKWQEGPVSRAWYLEVPVSDVTDDFCARLESMALRRERKHLQLVK